MYELIIVDDEEIIRKGLSSIVDWASLGFRVAAALPNGEAALEFVSGHPVDAVLADIVMPRRSGLELAAELRVIRPDIRVVILSGYDQSRYARQAIDCSVFGYLLKPSKEGEIREMMTRLKAALDEDRRRERLLSEHREEAIARELERRCLDPGAPDDPSVLPPSLLDDWLRILLLDAAGGRDAIVDAAGARFEGRVLFFPVGSRLLCALAHAPARPECEAAARDCAAFIEDRCRRPGQTAVSGGIGRAVQGCGQLAEAYASAAAGLERRLYLGPGKLADGGDPAEASPLAPGTVKEAAAQAAAALRSGDAAGAARAAATLFDALRTARIADRSLAQESVRSFHFRMGEDLSGYGIDLGDQGLPAGALAAVVGSEDCYDGMSLAVGRLLSQAAERLGQKAVDPTRRVILRARGLIDERFREALSLSSVAAELAISPPYLSRLFKQELGYNFKDYLTEVRMGEAKRLLADLGYKVYEIAGMVGFADQSYFSEIFKQHTGMSPLEYREKL